MENKTYFTKIVEEYKKATDYNEELYQNVGKKLDEILFGKVVDFGNGGVINYDTRRIKKLICVDIIFENKSITGNKINFVCGNFYDINHGCKADCVLAQVLLHHLTDEKKLRKCLRKVKAVLNKNGKFIIVEVAFPRFLELFQNIIKPILFNILAMMKKPSLRFFSVKSLLALLAEAGFNNIQIQYIATGKRVSPAPVLFPNLRIPGKLYPFKHILIEAKK